MHKVNASLNALTKNHKRDHLHEDKRHISEKHREPPNRPYSLSQSEKDYYPGSCHEEERQESQQLHDAMHDVPGRSWGPLRIETV